jgi:hypothetical protein
MNERIRELAEQAGVKMNAYGRPIPASLASNFDELAELIVKECARVAFESDLTMAIGQWGADSAILKHFGVEY